MVLHRWFKGNGLKALGLAASLAVAPLANAQSGGYGGDNPDATPAQKSAAQTAAADMQASVVAAVRAAWDYMISQIPDPGDYLTVETMTDINKLNELFSEYDWLSNLNVVVRHSGKEGILTGAGTLICLGVDHYLLDGHRAWLNNTGIDNTGLAGGPWGTWNLFKTDVEQFSSDNRAACLPVFSAMIGAISSMFQMWVACSLPSLATVAGIKGCMDSLKVVLAALHELEHQKRVYVGVWIGQFVPNYKALGQQTQSILNTKPRCEVSSGKMNKEYLSQDGVHVAAGFIDQRNQNIDADPAEKSADWDVSVIPYRPTVPKFIYTITTPDPQDPENEEKNKETRIVAVKRYYGQLPVDGYPYSSALVSNEYCGQYIGVPGLYNVPTGGSCTSGDGWLLKDRRGLTTSTAGDLTAKVMYSVYASGAAPAGWKQFQDRCSANSQAMLQECRESALGANDYQCRAIVHQTGGGGGFGGGY